MFSDLARAFRPAIVLFVLLTIITGIVYPVADGQTVLKVEYNGQTVDIPVKVEEAKAEQGVSFRLDVMPIFMRNTCNSGGCHGSSRGKDGFRLSLFGFDPAGDHYRLTREQIGRRINLAPFGVHPVFAEPRHANGPKCSQPHMQRHASNLNTALFDGGEQRFSQM